MESTPNSQRNDFFQKLKPCCVKLSQLAIREPEGSAVARQINDVTSQILSILNEQIQNYPGALDDKLAEYVFFPLYHVFKQMERYPVSLMENCIKCLSILIIHGWGSKISPKLVQQILTLLTFIIDGNPGSPEKRKVDEETLLESFRGLTALLNTAGQSVTAAAGLSDADTIPALGHGVSIMLDGAVDGETPQIQQEALRALQAVYLTIKEHAALASFLPGTISSLAKMLSTPAKFKKLVVAKAIDTVTLTLTRVLSDMRTRSILAKAESKEGEEDEIEKGNPLSPAWLSTTVIQVKKALSTIMKLRLQDSTEVKSSLRKLCVALLDECHRTLENCATFLVETAMILDDGDVKISFTETSLQHLVNIYPELGETVKTTAYNWMSSLPRIMQAGDEDVKQRAIHNLLKGLELLKALQIESSTLEDSISTALMNSVVSLVQGTKSGQPDESARIRLISGSDSQPELQELQYPPVLLTPESQKRIRDEMMSLVQFLGSSPQLTRFASNMLEQVQDSTSLGQVASFWLCFQLCKAGHSSSTEDEMFLDLSSLTDSTEDLDVTFNELYSTSVQILGQHSDVASIDWRMEATALEVTAYTAQRSGESFRPELIDVLFPIATFLGSKNGNLQKHAIITLNNLAASCGYENVSDLIIDNVDYMVNSVSLRLNTLDISPASINVLTMMIRLSGPRLVPYLDDVIESVFAALENYHGYPIFVENLFVVLKEVVDQGAQSDILLLEHQKTIEVDHRKKPAQADGISTLLQILEERKKREKRDEEEQVGHPEVPWKTEKEHSQGEEDDDGANPVEEEKPPNSSTYQLLMRVAKLTQHYLTSPTPTLRRSLLELLTTASSALAPDEDTFLPLVNAIWPVVVNRLQDPEIFVAVEACHTLSALCAAAGDFLGSRFKTEWGDWLRDWCRKVKRQASRTSGRSKNVGDRGKITGIGVEKTQILMPYGEKPDSGGNSVTNEVVSYSGSGLGQFASPARIWEATIELLTAMVSYVRVDEEMFDDVLDLLSETLDRNKKAREALEAINGDAVWLARYERGAVEWIPVPKVDGIEFVTMEMPS